MQEFDALGRQLGRAVSVRPGGPRTDRLRPTARTEARPRSLSASYGLGELPFHTDAAHHVVPPRYVLLRLDDAAIAKAPTLVAVVRPTEFSVREAATLSRETWLVRPGRARAFYAPIFDRSRMMVRFDADCMSQPAGTKLTGASVLEARLSSVPIQEVWWMSGRTLVLDNWRALHARPKIERGDADRALLRQLII
jgi:hypothetical protein